MTGMDLLTQMKNILLPLGLYSLTGETLVDHELAAYFTGLDRLRRRLSELERECFIQTAENFGLTMRETLYTVSKTDLPVAERRQRLLYRFSPESEKSTRGGVEKAMASLGLTAVIGEYLATQMILLANILPLPPNELKPLYLAAKAVLPANLRISFNIMTPNWNTLDALNYSFQHWDFLDLPWEIYKDSEI